MTAKKGSQWKTSWNRARGASLVPPPPSGDMRYFQNFTSGVNDSYYETLNPIALGATLPFWYSVVGIRAQTPTVTQGAYGNVFTILPSSSDGIVRASTVAGSLLVQAELPVATGVDFISAALVVVTKPTADSYAARLHLDNQVSDYGAFVGTFPTPASPFRLRPRDLPGGLHGFAGGTALPTAAEITAWFEGLKTNLEIQAIPGKTSHLYSAADVVGTPGAFPNAANPGTDDMTLVIVGVPAPQNNLITTTFPY